MALQNLEFLMIPLMSPGHIIPIIDMAKLFAERRVHITILVTPLHAARFSSAVHRAAQSIRLLEIRFPCQEAGLPPGCESADLLPSYALFQNFVTAIDLLQQPFEQMLIELPLNPSCIISDKSITWTVETCRKFNIPRIVFDGMSCFTQLVSHNIHISKIHQSCPPHQPFVVPGLPDEIEFTKLQLPGLFNPEPRNPLIEFREKVKKTESEAYGVVVNTFAELENRYVDEFRNVTGGRVWCIGPLSLTSNDDLDIVQRGNQASIDSDHCFKWLDKRKPKSVVFACFGSLSRLSAAQFTELALGLEQSMHSFVVVVKAGAESAEIERWILDEGIEERTRDRGLFVRGWAPQVLLLSHSAVGAFLTHCGWNSTLEAICSGVPMITWPMFAEQFLNEKLVVQILEIGVGVGARGVTHLGQEERDEFKVKRDGIKKAVWRVMDEGEEGCERRRRAEALAEMAKRSVEEGGSSYAKITEMIEEIEGLIAEKEDTKCLPPCNYC